MPFGRLDQSDEHYVFEVERAHRRRGSRKLALAAVDENKLRQRLLLVEGSSIAAKNRLIH